MNPQSALHDLDKLTAELETLSLHEIDRKAGEWLFAYQQVVRESLKNACV
jgi:hypothetical protein